MCNENKYLNTHSRQLSSMKFFSNNFTNLLSQIDISTNNLLIDYLILDPILFHSSKTKRNKNIKKKEKEKEGRNKNNPSSNKNRNPRRKYKLIRWNKKKTPMHHGLAPVRCNADEAIRILFPPETTLHFPFSSTFSSTFSFSSSLSSEQQNWTWFRHTSEKPTTAVFIFSRTLEPEV